MSFPSRGTKRIEDPAVFTFLVTENVKVAIIRLDLETAIADSVPLIQHVRHFMGWSSGLSREGKPYRALIGTITGIAFNLEFHGQIKDSARRGRRLFEVDLRCHQVYPNGGNPRENSNPAGKCQVARAGSALPSYGSTVVAASRRNLADSSGGVGLI
jgi:hypothetical protein